MHQSALTGPRLAHEARDAVGADGDGDATQYTPLWSSGIGEADAFQFDVIRCRVDAVSGEAGVFAILPSQSKQIRRTATAAQQLLCRLVAIDGVKYST